MATSPSARRCRRFQGVAQVLIFGSQKFAIRVQADPEAAAARGLSLDDIRNAVAKANSTTPVGTLNGPTRISPCRPGQLRKAIDYKQIVVAYRNGAPVKLDEVANIYDSVENDKTRPGSTASAASYWPSSTQPDANTVAVVDAVKAKLPYLREQIPPPQPQRDERPVDLDPPVGTDVEVHTGITIALVALVIFLFLRSAAGPHSGAGRADLADRHAAVDVRVRLLDRQHLAAGLTLAVGFVVDDAIVMLENIVRHIEDGMPPFEAALAGRREIGFTIVSITPRWLRCSCRSC